MAKFSKQYIKENFGVEPEIFFDAIKLSPSSQGYIHGAISEILLKKYLEKKGYQVFRIVEKPKGGYRAKSNEARGDFYIKRPKDKLWLVIESKGLKSNAEFSSLRRSSLETKEGLVRFLKKHIAPGHRKNKKIYQRAYENYKRIKKRWESKNKGKKFPTFRWDKNNPGPCNCVLNKIFKNQKDLTIWLKKFTDKSFTEEKYRNLSAPILILDTHFPSTRVGLKTGIKQAAPLVGEFNIVAVDLFLRTKKHEFVFMNSEKINHSPSSPEHLYQNYTIDILIKNRHEKVDITPPWYKDINTCIKKTKPKGRKIDKSQLDKRSS